MLLYNKNILVLQTYDEGRRFTTTSILTYTHMIYLASVKLGFETHNNSSMLTFRRKHVLYNTYNHFHYIMLYKNVQNDTVVFIKIYCNLCQYIIQYNIIQGCTAAILSFHILSTCWLFCIKYLCRYILLTGD